MEMDYPLVLGDIRVFRTLKHRPVTALAVRLVGQTRSRAIIVDGSAAIDPYWMVRVCKQYGFNEKDVFKKILVARGFTAYQLKDLVTKASRMIRENDDFSFLGLIALSERFADDDVGNEEGIWLRSQTVECVRRTVEDSSIYCAVADTRPEIYIKRRGGELHGKKCTDLQAGT